MIRHVAIEVGGDGIRINNVSPGLTHTPMTVDFPKEMFTAVAAHMALKRVAETVGDAAVWLCTNEARFVTGQSILVDGRLQRGRHALAIYLVFGAVAASVAAPRTAAIEHGGSPRVGEPGDNS